MPVRRQRRDLPILELHKNRHRDLRLVEQGRIDLDAPLPEQDFTLRQLLNHTSGLPDYGTLPAYRQAVAESETPWSRQKLVRAAMSQGMLLVPGTGWSCSNIGSTPG